MVYRLQFAITNFEKKLISCVRANEWGCLQDVYRQLITDYIDWRYEARRLSMYYSLTQSLKFPVFFLPRFTTNVTFPSLRYDSDDIFLVPPRTFNSNLHRLPHDLQTPLLPPRHAHPHKYPEPNHRPTEPQHRLIR